MIILDNDVISMGTQFNGNDKLLFLLWWKLKGEGKFNTILFPNGDFSDTKSDQSLGFVCRLLIPTH